MSNPIDNLLESAEQLKELNTWLANHSYLTIKKVAEHLSISRDQVDDLPEELLPWTDVSKPDSKRRAKRFRPTDVAAYHAVRWHYEQAKDEERLDEWLEARREQLADRRRRLMAASLGLRLDENTEGDSNPDITPTAEEQVA